MSADEKVLRLSAREVDQIEAALCDAQAYANEIGMSVEWVRGMFDVCDCSECVR